MTTKHQLIPLTALGLALFAIMAASSCNKNESEDKKEDKNLDAKIQLKENYIANYYYWNEQVKARNNKINAEDYTDIYEFFDALLYSGDRWSWMCDKDDLISMETGVVTGTWGISLGQAIDYYNDYSIRVRYVLPGSPFEKYGVTRGAQMTAIGGHDLKEPFTEDKLNAFNSGFALESNSFTFRLANGRDTTFTASKSKSLNTPSCLCSTIFTQDDFNGLTESVAYLNYISFTSSKIAELDKVLSSFHDKGVRKMILDLRYNPGGDVNALDTLISFIAPKDAAGKVYCTRKHNRTLAKYGYDESDLIKSNSRNLGLEDLYIITGEGTASCSEATINGLSPYMRVMTVGDTTYGKPNGMYLLLYPGDEAQYEAVNRGDYSTVEWAFLPICFYDVNSRREEIPDQGFAPQHLLADDLYHDFGKDEELIKSCLYHIAGGFFPKIPSTTKVSARKGIYGHLEEEKGQNYGFCIKKSPKFL